MKKIIIPIASVAVAAAASIAVIAANHNNVVSADLTNPPKEIPSGTYYLNGDTTNDDLTIVVDGGNIRFQSEDLREAFKAHDINLDPIFSEDSEALERQVDVTMGDWGDDYEYTVKSIPGRPEVFSVEIGNNRGIPYFPDTKTLDSWAGDFTLVE